MKKGRNYPTTSRPKSRVLWIPMSTDFLSDNICSKLFLHFYESLFLLTDYPRTYLYISWVSFLYLSNHYNITLTPLFFRHTLRHAPPWGPSLFLPFSTFTFKFQRAFPTLQGLYCLHDSLFLERNPLSKTHCHWDPPSKRNIRLRSTIPKGHSATLGPMIRPRANTCRHPASYPPTHLYQPVWAANTLRKT